MPDPTCAPAASILTPELVTLIVVPVVGAFVAWLRTSLLGEKAPAQVSAAADVAVQAVEESFAGSEKVGALKHQEAIVQVRAAAKKAGIKLTAHEAANEVLAAVHRAPGLGKTGNR